MGQGEDPVNSIGVQKSLSQNTIKTKSRNSASFEDPHFIDLKAKKHFAAFLQ